MAETKWTPGPWHVDDEGDVVANMPPSSFFLTTVIADFVDSGQSPNETRANARLIAVAPEMAHFVYDVYLNTGCSCHGNGICQHCKVAALLAKARGEA